MDRGRFPSRTENHFVVTSLSLSSFPFVITTNHDHEQLVLWFCEWYFSENISPPICVIWIFEAITIFQSALVHFHAQTFLVFWMENIRIDGDIMISSDVISWYSSSQQYFGFPKVAMCFDGTLIRVWESDQNPILQMQPPPRWTLLLPHKILNNWTDPNPRLFLSQYYICQGCQRFETSVFFSEKINISTTGDSRVGFFQPDTNHP